MKCKKAPMSMKSKITCIRLGDLVEYKALDGSSGFGRVSETNMEISGNPVISIQSLQSEERVIALVRDCTCYAKKFVKEDLTVSDLLCSMYNANFDVEFHVILKAGLFGEGEKKPKIITVISGSDNTIKIKDFDSEKYSKVEDRSKDLLEMLFGDSERFEPPVPLSSFPCSGEIYKYVHFNGEICTCMWHNLDVDMYNFYLHNCFDSDADIPQEFANSVIQKIMGGHL